MTKKNEAQKKEEIAKENDPGAREEASPDDLKKLEEEQERFRLHMGVAEQGKLYALDGDHRLALAYYREAMKMSVVAKDPEVFFRHYLDCVMESLEHMESYEEVLEYCDKAIRFYEEKPPPNPMAQLDLANIHQRKGVIQQKMEDREGAGESFREAIKQAGEVSQEMPLAQNLLRWIESHMHVDIPRIKAEQERTKYFIVRKDAVDSKKAVKLPNEKLMGTPF
ncbi:MAG: hypothetical protein GY849_02945 [Deltaproteobacteria bacterium]|nr:hypothetical protein [Deltaproteobacteria bacterium]